jgi:hypothetical protein
MVSVMPRSRTLGLIIVALVTGCDQGPITGRISEALPPVNPPPADPSPPLDAGQIADVDLDAGRVSTPPIVDARVMAPDAKAPAPDAQVMPPVVDAGQAPPPSGVPVLGAGRHTMDSMNVMTIGTSADRLATPRDLAFHPARPSELWVVNRADHSTVVIFEPGTPGQSTRRFWAQTGAHFLAEPSALAFGANGNMATIHETDDYTQGRSTPRDFMGPTMWSTDLSIFNGGHEGHIDMLHNSPNGMGIAWERDNVYWVFDGFHDALTRYDFNRDHGPGGTDHSDGQIQRFAEGQVRRVADIPSHMVYEPMTRQLYVADTGNSRIAVLDTMSGSRGDSIRPNYDGIVQYKMTQGRLTTFIDGAMAGLRRPSGLTLRDGLLFVGDNETGRIHAFDMMGDEVDYLDTGVAAGGLMGLAFDSAGLLYIVDALGDRIVRIAPRI